ncbi:13913_t:CDS:2, partial [Cetraspora pellucida]
GTETIGYLGFITSFFEKLMKNKEIIVDFTYKTNALEYKVYLIIGQFNGSGFAIVYLFVERKSKKDDNLAENFIENSIEDLIEDSTENSTKNLFFNSKQDILKDITNSNHNDKSLQLFSKYKTIL